MHLIYPTSDALRLRARSVICASARAWGLAMPPTPAASRLPALAFAYAF